MRHAALWPTLLFVALLALAVPTVVSADLFIPMAALNLSIPTPIAAPILFASGDSMQSGLDLYSMNADGSDLTQLTYTDDVSEHEAVWSPDRTMIAFTSVPVRGHKAIYIMDSTGGGRRRVTDDTHERSRPSWSPDGSRLTFEARPTDGGDIDIFIINLDGTGETNLTAGPYVDDLYPEWSPDGARIAFVSNRDAVRLFAVELATGIISPLSDPNYPSGQGPLDWRPDGAAIAWCNPGSHAIVLVNPSDGSARNLMVSGGGNLGPISLAWSPSGDRIVYDSAVTGPRRIWVVRADGSDPVMIASSHLLNLEPDW